MLVLGGTGRTGALVAAAVAERGVAVWTASRSGSDVIFDWDDPTSYPGALAGVDRVYLVPPVMRMRYADRVELFLDDAVEAGVGHVTLLSVFDADRAPRAIDLAAAEEAVTRRDSLTHTILRPAWVMQNFTDDHLPVRDGALVVPGRGAEAFVDAADIAAVAVETLLSPGTHAGAVYPLTGPRALTFDEVAATISEVGGRHVAHLDIDQEAWIAAAVAAGVPADYAVMLRWLTGAIVDGGGAAPTPDVERILGRPATDFESFARRHAGAWAWVEELR
ncbi:NAD(P)H-binding protein [Tsukamurella soli]|uniref:NAD(P)H-binding protein n=1 Tax=Tsukamurella soli TaxID=644556 RepID=A0ABP8J9Y4_9ACTN